MSQHVANGVDAVVESANKTSPNIVFVNPSEVDEALDQIKKLTGKDFPEVKLFKGDNSRIGLRI